MHSALLQFNLRICIACVLASSLIVVSAQNGTSPFSNSLCNFQCPSGFHCFNNTVQKTVIIWGHNGHICDGQSPGECYNGEVDPLGFQRGPRQLPQTVIQGDNVTFEPVAITLEVLNVSRDAFYSCDSTNGQLVENKTNSLFPVPSEYLNPPGIKYFITKHNSFSCSFGIRLELYVRSRQQPGCINPATPNLGVCSGVGLCTSQANTFFTRNYSCSCCAAYQGDYCEELDSCHASRNPSPCQNGATCHDIIDGVTDSFNCSCLPGYEGTNCEKNINECLSNPCINGGFCVDYINEYKCLCQPDTEGVNCEIVIEDLCADNPCANGGTCLRSGDKRRNYTCTCPPNFTGRNCTVNITSSVAVTSTPPFQTSKVSTSSVTNSSHVTQGLSTSSMITTAVTSSIPKTSSQIMTGTSSSQEMSPAMSSQQLSSVSMNSSKTITFISPTLHVQSPLTVRLSSSFLSVRETVVSSSLPTTKTSSQVTFSSVFIPTVVSSTVSQAVHVSPLRTSSGNPTMVTMTTKSMEKFSSRAPSNSSLHLTSSPASSLPLSLSVSLLLKSSPALASTVTDPASKSSAFSPAASLPVTMVTMTTKSLEKFSSRAARNSSLQLTSSPASSLPQSSSLSLLLKSSPAVASTVTDPASKSSVFSSSASLPVTLKSSTRTTPLSLSLSTVYSTSTVKISPSMSTVLISSSVVPTASTTPTTVPLINQTCIDNPCNNGTCLDESYLGNKFRCECPYPTVGPVCSGEFDLHFPAFGRNSFLEHKSISFNMEENRIDITFQTSTSDGLLLFAADNKGRGDFIQMRVVGGKLEFRFNPGDSLVYIQSIERVDTGETVTATATYVSNKGRPFGTLQVDNGAQLKREVSGKLIGIQLYDIWYIGGVPPGLDMLNKTKGQAAPSLSFVGSIKDVKVNGETINLADAKDWYNINEGDMPPCQRMPCRNDGVCIPHRDNVHGYTCNCTTGFGGMNCETHIACESESCNGGECIPKASNPLDFVCLCPFGRVGVQCQTAINITIPLFTIIQDFPSYLEYQAPRSAVKSFHVTFQFQLDNASTSWNDSLLVYSAQNEYLGSGDDFFAVGLKDNMVLLQYNLGAGSARIYSEPLNRNKEWHVVVAGRDGLDGWLYVDNQERKEGKSEGSHVGLNLAEPLFIGGIPDPRQIPSVLEFKSGGFHGSIYDVAIRFGNKRQFIQLSTSTRVQASSKEWAVLKGRNVGDGDYDECSSRTPPCYNAGTCKREGATYLCSCPAEWAGLYCSSRRVPCYGYDNPCISGTCRPDGHDVKCDCPLGKTGELCDQDILIQAPLFQNFSYMMFPNTYIRTDTRITIKFKPLSLNGILFYVSRDDQSTKGDFLSIILHNGFVKLRYDLGKGVGEAKSNSTVTLNTWHMVQVNRTARSGTLIVNSGVPVRVTSPGTDVALDVNSNFYLGGVRKLSNVNPNAVDNDPAFVQDFTGCIDHFEVNGVLYFQPSTGALEGRNIANCPESISQHAL